MSVRSLSLGVTKRIRDALGDADGRFVGHRPSLRPPPGECGQWYVAVGRATSARGATTSGDVDDRVYTLQVCVTCKYGYAPDDRRPDHEAAALDDTRWEQLAAVANGYPEIQEIADRVAGLLIEDYATLAAANSFIDGYNTSTNGFVEPFHQFSVGDIQVPGPQWVGGDGGDDGASQIETVTITFSGARRLRVRGTLS